MKKLKTIIAAILLAMCCVNANATVTITAPEKPESIVTEVTAGKSYYFYNTAHSKFINRSTRNNTYAGYGDTPYAFRIDESTDGFYAFWQGDSYIGNSGSTIYWQSSTDNANNNVRFEIIKHDETGLYAIKHVYRNKYLGFDSADGYLKSNWDYIAEWRIFLAETNIDMDEAESYINKKYLYDAIVKADSLGYHVERYEDIYNDTTKTNAELNSAADELNNAQSLSDTHSYLFPSWSDYPILITDIGSWTRNGSNNELWKRTYKSGNQTTNTFKTSVYVDEPSTFSFRLSCGYDDLRTRNHSAMPIQVYVDGQLVYDHNGETWRACADSYLGQLHATNKDSRYNPYGQYYNYYTNSYNFSNNRHFIELTPGHHLIDIVATQNYSSNNYFQMYLLGVGVEKTPTIEVNLAKVGSLGDEVLRAMDNNPLITETNIRNVRKLKISGKMGDSDFEELYNMPYLYSLDLTDADVTEIKPRQLSYYNHSTLEFLHEIKLPKKLVTIGQEAFYCTHISDVDIPETVTSIGDFAFSNTRIREANIPNVTTLGHNAFRGCTMLNKVVMKNVESMGISTFAECYNLRDIIFEGSPAIVPQYTFYNCYKIDNISIPETVSKIEYEAFYQTENLNLKKLPDGLETIEAEAFYRNLNSTFCLPEGLKVIGNSALFNTDNLSGDIPSTVTSIGEYGMRYAWWTSNEDTVHIPANATFGKGAFQNARMKNVVIPQEYYKITTSMMFANCDSLKSIKLMSPTLVSVPADFVDGLTKKNIKVYVPDYLRTTYMRDSYWMDFTIVGFSTTEMDSIVIRQDLALSQHDRFLGKPDLAIEKGVKFELEGVAGMDLKNITLSSDLEANNYSQIVSGTDQVSVNGLASERLYTKANKWYFISLPFDCKLSQTVNENGGKYAIRYYDGASRAAESGTAYSYPESAHNYADDMKKETGGNLQRFSYPGASTLKIIFNEKTKTYNSYDYIYIMDAAGKRYDYYGNIGARTITIDGDHFDIWIESNSSNVAYGYSIDAIYADDVLLPKRNGDNWKNYDCTKDIIPAGTGFIFMTSKDSWTRFYSVDNGTKNRIFEDSENENNEFHYELQKHPSEDAANRGWNLVGNPYPNYYNNHKISFAAPITLWDGTTYKAYSLRDDDIAIKPNQAIFVQCPEDVAEISFPAAGRQTTNVITDQANAHVRGEVNNVRQIVDLSLTNGTYTDDTRVVINPEASLSYEVGCDAGKFMSMDAAVQQLYTLDATNNRYAINERPLAEGRVVLGISIPAEGTYTFSLKRNQAETVLLIDNETGFTHDLTADDYTFTAKAGANDGRFVLNIIAPEVTGVEEVESNDDASHDDMYTVDGIRVNSAAKSGVYIKRNGKNVTKVVVK